MRVRKILAAAERGHFSGRRRRGVVTGALAAALVATSALARPLALAADAVGASPITAPPPQAIPETNTTADDAMAVRPSAPRRALALGAAVVPGLVLHGAGHFSAGDRSTGLRLLAWEGIGLAAIVAGVGGLAVTGASSRTAALFIPLMIGGAGLFGTTWLSDVYGVAAGQHVPGRARAPSAVQAEVGTRYVYDRIFTYRAFLVAGADWRPGAFRVTPSAWLATNGSNQRLRLEGAWRIAGSRLGDLTADGSFVDLEVAATHHRYGREHFAITLGEVAVSARLDLGRAAGTLDGSFVEGALGVAAGGTTYFDRATEATDLLLGRLGWGVYWGGSSRQRGEAALSYDHRHDGYAGGAKLPGLGSGTMGSFGVRASGTVWRWAGVAVEGRAGSAYIVGASLLIRPEGAP